MAASYKTTMKAKSGFQIRHHENLAKFKNKRNPEKIEEFWEKLDDKTPKIPQNNSNLLMGNFNSQSGREKKYPATVGRLTAHKRTNRNGERLINLCRMSKFKIMPTHFKA